MTPVEREIITAKHHHGLKPSQIARLLEIPVRRVVAITGSLPIVRRLTEQAIREAMGNREFRVGDLAEAFGAEHATAGAHIRALEARGKAYRAGERITAGGQKATVWKPRGM